MLFCPLTLKLQLQVATLQAEIQTLREEHRAETAALRAEVVRIRAENNDMRNRLGIMEGADEQINVRTHPD